MRDPAPTLAHLKQNGVAPVVSNALVVHHAQVLGLQVSFSKKGRILLQKDGQRFYFKGGRTDFNTQLAIRCTRQKDVTSRLLRHRAVPAPENYCFNYDEDQRAWNWAQSIMPVVIKPVASTKGRSVFLNINDNLDFRHAFKSVSSKYGSALVEAFTPGTEHRILVIDGRVVAATRRVPAHVVADGTSTIAQLVDQKNQERALRKNPVHQELVINQIARDELSRQGLAPESVPETHTVVTLRGTSNIHTGGDAIDATEDLSEGEISIIEFAARALPGLRIGGFDVLLPRQPGEKEINILEINDNAMLSMHHFPWQGQPRDVVPAMLKAMFPSVAISPRTK